MIRADGKAEASPRGRRIAASRNTLAEGTRLFEHTGQASHELKLTQLTKAPDVTHLHYQLMRNHEACTVEQD